MKSILIAALVLFWSVQSYISNPPEAVSKAFKLKFPSAVNIKWIEEENRTEWTSNFNGKIQKSVQDLPNTWKVSFKLKDKNATATFTEDGHWLRSELETTISDVREEVQSSVKKDHPKCEVLSVLLIETFNQGTWYHVKVKCGNSISTSEYDWNGWPPPKF